jgi:hypothetical protein
MSPFSGGINPPLPFVHSGRVLRARKRAHPAAVPKAKTTRPNIGAIRRVSSIVPRSITINAPKTLKPSAKGKKHQRRCAWLRLRSGGIGNTGDGTNCARKSRANATTAHAAETLKPENLYLTNLKPCAKMRRKSALKSARANQKKP